MFVTSKAVGRVVDIEERGDDLLVTIRPVDITDVIHDGRLEVKQERDLADLAQI